MSDHSYKELVPEFNGIKNVFKYTFENGLVLYRTQGSSFAEESRRVGACMLNVSNNNGEHYLYLFNASRECVGQYIMQKRLWDFTKEQLAIECGKLFFFKEWNQENSIWVTYIDGTPARNYSYKEGCGLVTLLKDNKWSVVDKKGNYIVSPGKYDYIDGFDKCGLTRVKINGKTNIWSPDKSTRDRWGIIDTTGKEILPVVYTEIWSFYNKGRTNTTVWKGDTIVEEIDGVYEKVYDEKVYKYKFDLSTHKLRMIEDWSLGNYNCLDPRYESEDDASIWDALDGDPSAAGNIDYEM